MLWSSPHLSKTKSWIRAWSGSVDKNLVFFLGLTCLRVLYGGLGGPGPRFHVAALLQGEHKAAVPDHRPLVQPLQQTLLLLRKTRALIDVETTQLYMLRGWVGSPLSTTTAMTAATTSSAAKNKGAYQRPGGERLSHTLGLGGL